MLHSTNYKNTFIQIADDCPAGQGEIPPMKGEKLTVAGMQFDMIYEKPYHNTSDDVFFELHARKAEIPESELEEARKLFFSKGRACFRASRLTKRYGWGVHSNAEGKIALFACNSPEYEKLASDKTLKQVKAMRTSR